MMSRYTPARISRILFETDPMNTCCKENDCFDEYDRVAEAVAARIEKGQSPQKAFTEEISEWFFDGETFDISRLEPAIEILAKEEQ